MTDMDARIEVLSDLLKSVCDVSFWKFDGEGRLMRSNCSNASLFERLFTAGGCRKRLLDSCKEHKTSSMSVDSLSLVWLAAPHIANNVLLSLYMIGPVFSSEISEANMAKAARGLQFPPSGQSELMSELKKLPIIQHINLMQYGAMLHYCITGERISAYDILIANSRTDGGDGIREIAREKKSHSNYAEEQQLFKIIETGNIEAKPPVGNTYVGKLSVGDPLRQVKNQMICFIVLATRAALRGGLQESIAYSLSDSYIQMVESKTDINDVCQCYSPIFDDFLHRVYRHKLSCGRSREIQSCVSYIDAHIADRFDYEEMAKDLGYNRNYFFLKFKKEMGVTPNEYVLQKKIELACLWLRNTSRSIQEIAFSLNFSSVSYFGSVFRKYAGVSPRNYR